jgi:hypothetical protein
MILYFKEKKYIKIGNHWSEFIRPATVFSEWLNAARLIVCQQCIFLQGSFFRNGF